MQRIAIVFSLTMLTGCGSCLDDKRVPDADAAAAPYSPKFVNTMSDAGGIRRLDIGSKPNVSGAVKVPEAGGNGT